MHQPPEIILFLGRFHPLLVHLPIGMVFLLAALEAIARLPRFKTAAASAGFILALAGQTDSAVEAKGDLPPGLEWEAGLVVYNGQVLAEDPVRLLQQERMAALFCQAVTCQEV